MIYYFNKKKVKQNGLYVLLSKTLIDSSNLSVNYVDDKTILWHNRLRHISEKCLRKDVNLTPIIQYSQGPNPKGAGFPCLIKLPG